MKCTPKNTRVGDTVKTVMEVKAQYYDYPQGCNLIVLPAGSICQVCSMPAKVHLFGDGYDTFVNLTCPAIAAKPNGIKYLFPCNFSHIITQ